MPVPVINSDDVVYCPHCTVKYKFWVKQPNALKRPLARYHKVSRYQKTGIPVYICDECAATEMIAPMLDMQENQVRYRMEIAKAKKRADEKTDGGYDFGAKAPVQPESYFASDTQLPATSNIDLMEIGQDAATSEQSQSAAVTAEAPPIPAVEPSETYIVELRKKARKL